MKQRILFNCLLTILLVFVNQDFINGQTRGIDFEFIVKSPASIAGSYGWDGTTDFGGSLEDDLCGELVWADDIEELGCSPLTSDLTGKIALIRRGSCFFSLKIYNAQEAGAKAVVVVNHNQDSEIGLDGTSGMAAGDSASAVTIPAIFVSYNTGVQILSALNLSQKVEVCFELATFNLDFGPYSYFTPQSQIVPLDNMSIRLTNRTILDKVGLETKIQITDPNGQVQEIVSTNDLPAGEFVDVFFDSYVPGPIGEYNMKYISGLDAKELERKFEITEFTWGMDNGVVDRAIGPSPDQFASSNFFYQHGNLVLSGADGVASYVTFGLGNGPDLFTGDPSADLVLIAIYNGDRDGDLQIDDFSSFEDLGDPIEVGFYEINGNETFDQLITVPLDNPVALKKDGIYYVSIAYDGINAGTGIGPLFSGTSDVNYLNFPSTPLQLDQLYSGWAGSVLVTRLQLEGFPTSTQDLKPLSADKLKILSNPIINNKLTFELTLENVSNRIEILFRNLDGKLLKRLNYTKTSNLLESIDVTGLPTGTYFLNILTDEGFRSEKVMVVRP